MPCYVTLLPGGITTLATTPWLSSSTCWVWSIGPCIIQDMSLPTHSINKRLTPRGHTIFTEPYITRLTKGMGLLGDMNHLPTVGWYNPISLHSLHMMGPISLQHPMGTTIPLAADPSSFIGHPSLYCLGWSIQRIADHCMSSSAPPANNYSPEETSWFQQS